MNRALAFSTAFVLFITITVAGMFVSTSPAGSTAEEAKAMVEDAIVYFKAQGKAKAIEAFCDPKGEFIKEDLYVNLYDLSGTCIAHGANPKLMGKNLIDLKDANGKLFIQEIVATAKTGGGWVDYQWTNPETKKLQHKSSYVKSIDGTDYFIFVGIYK